MLRNKLYKPASMAFISLALQACSPAMPVHKTEHTLTPAYYTDSHPQDSSGSGTIAWSHFFNDPYLTLLIDTALQNNQELNIILQEIQISKNEIRVRKGEYLPFVGIKAGAGAEKPGRYTSRGANDAQAEMLPGKEIPETLPDFMAGAYATWELDIWHKLRNAKKAAVARYLSSIEGKNFMVTNLVAEIASAYYELLALDNELDILESNIEIQKNALQIVKLQKEAAHVTELAVRRFEAQVLHTQSLQYSIQQQIIETENRINFLLGRYPQNIKRNSNNFAQLIPTVVKTGIPAQLLSNRPDIRQAEQELAAAKLDVKVAKARFYPSVGLSASIGYQAFDPAYFLKTPESLLYSLAGDLAAPLINRNAIKAAYYSANAKQIQTVYAYERTILNGYIEVVNALSKIQNLDSSYNARSKQVAALSRSVEISNDLFASARADYMEVLLTQRDALEAKFEMIDTRKEQLIAVVNVYRSLGGGWR